MSFLVLLLCKFFNGGFVYLGDECEGILGQAGGARRMRKIAAGAQYKPTSMSPREQGIRGDKEKRLIREMLLVITNVAFVQSTNAC